MYWVEGDVEYLGANIYQLLQKTRFKIILFTTYFDHCCQCHIFNVLRLIKNQQQQRYIIK